MKAIGIILLGMLTITLNAVFAGTIIWLLWDYLFIIIPEAANYVKTDPLWWEVVCFSWLTTFLFKSNINTSSK